MPDLTSFTRLDGFGLAVTVRRYRCKECSHVWRHARRGDKCVKLIIDLTPVHAGTGSASTATQTGQLAAP